MQVFIAQCSGSGPGQVFVAGMPRGWRGDLYSGYQRHPTVKRPGRLRAESIRQDGQAARVMMLLFPQSRHLGEQVLRVCSRHRCRRQYLHRADVHRVDPVDEDQTRIIFFGALNQSAHLAGTNTNKHLHEFQPERENSNTCPPMALARSALFRRANQQHTLGNLRSTAKRWLLQEGTRSSCSLRNACHIIEFDPGIISIAKRAWLCRTASLGQDHQDAASRRVRKISEPISRNGKADSRADPTQEERCRQYRLMPSCRRVLINQEPIQADQREGAERGCQFRDQPLPQRHSDRRHRCRQR